MDYDDAIKLDKRKFCPYFWERVKSNILFLDIIFIDEPTCPRSIKTALLLVNFDLYFLINALYMNEDYISEIYHSNDESFFNFVPRTNNNLFYILAFTSFSRYLITCFFFDEKKIKNIFRREKTRQFDIKKSIFLVTKDIKFGYLKFFITTYIIMIFSWYIISCFNSIYQYSSKEWIKSSISIFLAMQIIYILSALIETIIRFLSFKFKNEKLFKITKILH